MKKFRRGIARRLWDFAQWLYPYDKSADTADEKRGWELSWYIEAPEAIASETFDRMSDALCGEEHHALDPCPGPMFVGGMHPADD